MGSLYWAMHTCCCLLVSLIGLSQTIQVLSQFSTTVLSNYPSSSRDCAGKISAPVIAYACGRTLYFGLFLKRLESVTTTNTWASKYLVFANTVVYFKSAEERTSDAIIKATHYQIKGGGPDPSFESSNAKFIFGKKVIDGDLHHVQANNTHFVFSFIDAVDGENDAYKPRIRKYFEEFDSSRLLQDPPSTQVKKWLIVTILDIESTMFIKTAEIELDASLSTNWEDVKVSYLGLYQNRQLFHTQIDKNTHMVLGTVQNSLRMSVLAQWKGDTFVLESPLSPLLGYTFVHSSEGLVLSAQEHRTFNRLLAQESVLSESTFREAFVSKQVFNLRSPKLAKTTEIVNGLGMLLTVSQDNNLVVYGSYYRSRWVQGGFSSQDLSSDELVLSKFTPVLQKEFKGQILDVEISHMMFPGEEAELRPFELNILLLNRTDDLIRLVAPICPPNYLLEVTSDLSSSHRCRPVTGVRHYSPGLQSNEVKEFDDKLSSLENGDLLVDEGLAYTAGYMAAIVKFSLESPNIYLHEGKLVCAAESKIPKSSEWSAGERCFGNRPARGTQCHLYSDCFNCSLDIGCLWNNSNHICDKFRFGDDPREIHDLSHYDNSVYFTGSKALDLAAMKIHNTCPKRFDMQVENYQGGSYYNLSLVPEKLGEPVLVRRGFAYSIDIGDKSEVFDYSVRIELFNSIWPKDAGQSPVMIFRGAKVSKSQYNYRDTATSGTVQVNMFEFLRKWRHTGNSNSVSGMYTAESLSISIIFPEDTIVNGTLKLHLVETDRWLTEFMVYTFVFLVLGFVVGVLCLLSCLGCARCFLIRTGRPVPNCLQRYIKPILRNYKFYLANKSIKETQFKPGKMSFNQDKCPICLELFNEGEKVSKLRCSHIFHIVCITEWVNKLTEKSQLCPVCNHEIGKPHTSATSQVAEQSPDQRENGSDNPESEILNDTVSSARVLVTEEASLADIELSALGGPDTRSSGLEASDRHQEPASPS